MATTAVRRERSGMSESGPEPGWFVGLLPRRRGVVLLVALLLMALAGVAGRDAGDKLVSGAYLDPSAESQQAAELLTHQFPGDPPNLVLIVETTTGTLNSSEVAQSGRALTEQLAETPGVAGVQSYWTTPDPALRGADDRSADVTVLPIVMNTREQITADMTANGVTTPFLLDDGTVSEAYGTLGKGMHAGLPGHSFVLIDRQGLQRWYGEYPSMWLPPQDLLDEIRSNLSA